MKIKLVVEYFGRSFSGFQYQAGRELRTVQGEIESALLVFFSSIVKKLKLDQSLEKIPITGSGRTDSGVHARAQIVSFKVPEIIPREAINIETIRLALNSLTHVDLVVRQIEEVDESFDARFSPHVKCYSYRIITAPSTLIREVSWFVPGLINIPGMIKASKMLVGQHDFQRFRAKDCSSKTSIRTLYFSELTRINDNELLYTVHGKGFLKQMVRIVVGTLVEIGKGKRPPEDIERLLKLEDVPVPTQTAPARGLMMEWVRYGEGYF